MRLIQNQNNLASVLAMYQACLQAPESAPRGQKVRNVANMAVVFDATQPVLTTFAHRKLNLNYCKREWLWYLGADPKDDSIAEHATAWKKLQQPDGSYYSNYGQYMFGFREEGRDDPPSQFEYVVQQLRKDPDTRRACMILLQRDHLFDANTDTVCTYAIHFAIYGGSLDMTVMMRSNDVVWGFTNDAFCFQQLYEFVYQLVALKVPGLQRGQYTHMANSMHVYERHYEMLAKIVRDPRIERVHVPKPTPQDVSDLYKSRGKGGSGEYCEWLKAVD
jgi:thymidylate synthase